MILRKILIVTIVVVLLLGACSFDTETGKESEAEQFADNDENIIVSSEISERKYFIIRSDYSPQEETNAAVKLRKALEEFTGAAIGISTDWEKNPVYEYEFIVGTTLREQDENVLIDRISLGESGFIIKAVNNKVYIAGGQTKGTTMAVDYFISTFMTGNNTDKIVIPKDYNYIQYHQYDIPQLYIGGTLIDASYVIQCMDTKNMRLAESLQSSIYYKTGLWMEIITGDDLNGKNAAIVLSNAEPKIKGIYQITVEGSSIVFASSASSGLGLCVESFISLYLENVYGAYSFESDFTYVDLGDYIIITMPEVE